MDRLACVNVPCLSLQLLIREHPDWKQFPTAVVTEDKPLGIITEINKNAKKGGIKIGMRYSAALAVEPLLHAGEVSNESIAMVNKEILDVLLRFSPEIEPFPLQFGVFWVNAHGLDRLYTSLHQWVHDIQQTLQKIGLTARVCVGFSRFGSFIAAKRSPHPIIFLSQDEEKRFCTAVHAIRSALSSILVTALSGEISSNLSRMSFDKVSYLTVGRDGLIFSL